MDHSIFAANEQHVYHHSEDTGPRINVKVERNSRGTNYEATVTGARSTAEALTLLTEAEQALKALYGPAESA